MKTFISIILLFIQIPFFIEGCISFVLNAIIKYLTQFTLFRSILLYGFISYIWWPLDILSASCWAILQIARGKLLGIKIEFHEALNQYIQLFPQL